MDKKTRALTAASRVARTGPGKILARGHERRQTEGRQIAMLLLVRSGWKKTLIAEAMERNNREVSRIVRTAEAMERMSAVWAEKYRKAERIFAELSEQSTVNNEQ